MCRHRVPRLSTWAFRVLSMHWMARVCATLPPGGDAAPPLLVIGPHSLRRFLTAYGQVEPLAMTFVDCRAVLDQEWDAAAAAVPLVQGEDSGGSEDGGGDFGGGGWGGGRGGGRRMTWGDDLSKVRAVCRELGLRRLSATHVVHCAHSFALTLQSEPKLPPQHWATGGATAGDDGGWKLVYSGDTRPCPALTAASKNATVLIHEATFENGMLEDALKKRHSTTSEAVQTGIDAGAYRTILTHFSQRYPKIPVFDGTYTARTAVAFDLMRVDFKALPRLPSLLPAVRNLFKDLEEEEQAQEQE